MVELIEPTTGACPHVHSTVTRLVEEGGTVLDLGAGSGNFTHWLEATDHSAVAVDLDPGDYRRAKAPLVQADPQQPLPIRSASVDGVVAIEVIEHIETPIPFLREAHRVLRHSGWCIFTTPHVDAIASRLELLIKGTHSAFRDEHYETNGHISPVSMQQIKRVCRRIGFTIEVETYNVGRLPVPKLRTRYAIKSSWARRRPLGETLIVKLRKTGQPSQYHFG